ncbi:capsular polysaccharide export protein [Oceanicella actignis]|uniref:Capsular polysaccharide export protein n=2 Tax=Oceanicella actignis TaxID=1189325 RepID=A0A1M7TU82_9RHOB|nr:capsular polysaccharide export protein [Oceanicella actignis]SHN74238.1 capsular polysaccharide export protein [Oceanicella actignis]
MAAGAAGMSGEARARTALLLQGPSSFFFSYLGDALEARGARVLRVHLCPGDMLFWRRGGGRVYRGGLARWPAWIEAFMAREGVSDLVLLGAHRPFHAPAIAAARRLGVLAHHVELGYFRPDWITVELDGAGPDSRFAREAERFMAQAAAATDSAAPPQPARRFASSFAAYAAMDMAWNLSNLALSWALTPGYRRHQLWHPLAEYGGFGLKLAAGPLRRRAAGRALAALARARGPMFLFPLQLRTDHQIRVNGPDPDLRATARRVVRSFAAHAPADAVLAVKEHPMDNGLTPWRRLLEREAAACGAAGRVRVFDGGDLDALIARSAGVVTVNSTVGLAALAAGRPVKALGRALFDRPGLTDQAPLDAFWRAPAAPDPALARDFLAALRWATQLRGAFDGEGALPGAEAAAERILHPRL